MRSTLKWFGLVTVVLAIASGIPHAAHAAVAAVQHPGVELILPMLVGAVRFPVTAYTYDQLNTDSRPGSASAPESIPYVWYDSQNFATLWTTIAFFAVPSNDPTISNIEQANTFSAEQYFRLWAVTLDWLISATVASSGAAPVVDDLLQIQNGARAILNLAIAQKKYLQVPIHAVHSSGGIFVNFQVGAVDRQYGMNWMPDGGYNVGGAIVFPPKQTFICTITGVAAALVATRMGRLSLHGVLSRPVR